MSLTGSENRREKRVKPLATFRFTLYTQRGFTLIEMMVVMVIIVVMSSIAIISLRPALADARLRSGSRMVVSMLNYARSFAVSHRTEAVVVFDKENAAIGVKAHVHKTNGDESMEPVSTPSGRYRKLPNGVKIAQVQKPGTREEDDLVAYTDLGQADPAAITLQDSDGGKRIITIDPITGHCDVTSGQDK